MVQGEEIILGQSFTIHFYGILGKQCPRLKTSDFFFLAVACLRILHNSVCFFGIIPKWLADFDEMWYGY